MTDKPENPPAFPVAWPVPNAPEPGMTLRDYFAAAALNGVMAASGSKELAYAIATESAKNNRLPHDQIAVMVYSLADAMLKARQS